MGRGEVAAQPMLFANLPSVADPTMRTRAGGEVLSLEVLFTPFQLAGGWAGSPEPKRWLAACSTLLDGDIEDSIADWRVMTPPDYEAQFSLDRGLVPSFSGSALGAIIGRRDRELTRYETPIGGLYLTGGGTDPGAGIWGALGRNTADVILNPRRRGLGTPDVARR